MTETGNESMAKTSREIKYENKGVNKDQPTEWSNDLSGPQMTIAAATRATGRKDDQEKSLVDLLDAEFLEEMGHVMAHGARKYHVHNWRGGIAYSRLIGAALRHLLAVSRGEDIDPESGYAHIAHAGCAIMFLFSMMKHRKELDDRYKQGENHALHSAD